MDILYAAISGLVDFFFSTLPWSLTHVVAVLFGAWGYRWMQKSNPQRLEAWVKFVNAFPQWVSRLFTGKKG